MAREMYDVKNITRSVLLLGLLSMTGTAWGQVSDDVVRVLMLTNLFGNDSSLYTDIAGDGQVIAAEMAVEGFESSVAGSRVELIVRDNDLDPDKAVAQLRALHEEKPIDMVTGIVSSGIGVAVVDYAERNGITTLLTGASSSSFTGEGCSPLAVQWGFNTYTLARAAPTAVVREGGDRWYFITADYEFGHSIQKEVTNVVEEQGGTVVGASVVPYPAEDLSEALGAAVAAGANVVGLANAGEDTQLAIRQSYELGLGTRGVDLVALEFYLTDIRSLGLYVTRGLSFATSFYWNEDEQTRQWSQQFSERSGSMPTAVNAMVYSAVRHYLEAVDAVDSDEATAVMKQMRKAPVDDGVYTTEGRIRTDGSMLHDMLLVSVKNPTEAEEARDYLNVVRTIPAEEAFRPLGQGGCPLAAGG